ncbi:phosphotyrosyl phosphatase activator [Schizosaccharomyces cryophilus OY26]|uniref:Serine/threonine-protein phosphatase 2A activator n=1 Tax=Schizosaccharomyces cryophilus (strain OY26 / ATCC MYA-4695 / CBS 11777 / NBRC 106824 / NRRL Y48691) TaxID=653667 RepID=S9VWN9_SCHCR|nr:phosphotyrosyl phosphatase activator [Schizosaccharomyces cryophilus OY26]EPY50350.1 phosphotyrosyl phosphatase activator [Schizosaccharomyces cryophilus OY26]
MISVEEQNRCFVPVRRILNNNDLNLFKESEAYRLIDSFICDLNESIQDKPISAEVKLSPSIEYILLILKRVEEILNLNPPVENKGSRFGNPAFESFYDQVECECPTLHAAFGLEENAIGEAGKYFYESFGNRKRIDYGSGHELNFMTWLLSLRRLDILTKEDYPAIVLRIFVQYINLMRLIQTTYFLEPAGSHGVWGLDDFHFLPFLFGSSQLVHHKYLRPKHVRDPEILEMCANDYMYLGYVRFINELKPNVSLRFHSPMIDDISSVKTWAKVNEGMIKMYRAEVLSKLPIMQHYLFGYLIPAVPSMSAAPQEGEDAEISHIHSTYGDCCGIKIPSAIAASKTGWRRLPFD